MSSKQLLYVVWSILLTNINIKCLINGKAINSSKPNIIFVLIDDMGYHDLGFMNNDLISTPNINKYREEGQFFEWMYGQSTCSPTRAALMTGRYPIHNGINKIIDDDATYGVYLNNTFISKTFYDNGYDTHMIGKWHLGMYKWSYTPTYRGYKSFYGYFQGAEDYFTHIHGNYWDFHSCLGINCGPKCCQLLQKEVNNTYSTFLFTNKSIEIIKNNSLTTDPLFLYLPYQSVHDPAQVPSSYSDPYFKKGFTKSRAVYSGKLSCMDEGIGNITNVLQEYGYLDDNGSTIIIFQSDNGGPVPNVSANGACNYPLKGGKYSIWEGGSRLSGLIWATIDLIPNKLRGRNYTQLMHVVDYYTTLCAAANIDCKFDKNGLELDGINHWNGITSSDNINDKYFAYRDNVYYGYYEKHKAKQGPFNDTAMRYKWYKLFNGSGGNPTDWWQCDNFTVDSLLETANDKFTFQYDGNPVLLYDLETDYIEKYDVSKSNTNIVSQIWNMMLQIEQTADPTPTPDNSCPPITYPDNSWLPWCGEY